MSINNNNNSPNTDVIAWLVPTARASFADKATQLPSNKHRTIPTSSPTTPALLTAQLPNLIASKPSHAIQLSFAQPPKRPGSFVLGADPSACDIVLPPLPGIAPRHCALSFDAEARLVLRDFSAAGTQVWYDWESAGDRTAHTWLLDAGRARDAAFPGAVRRITVDIQGVRFQVVVNAHARAEDRWDAFRADVDDFLRDPAWLDGLSAGWDRASVTPVPPLFSAMPLFQHIFVKALDEGPIGEMYLWNLARPWEPMVKAAA